MNRVRHIFVWLSRIFRCRGFGIQSPTDYRFVRYVVNEHWPYYAYEQFDDGGDWLGRRLGRLYFRLANERQPATVVDLLGAAPYVEAACKKASITTSWDGIGVADMALLPTDTSVLAQLEAHSDDSTVAVFHDIAAHRNVWNLIKCHPRVVVTFDLYYCGIVFFDTRRQKHHYIVNF